MSERDFHAEAVCMTDTQYHDEDMRRLAKVCAGDTLLIEHAGGHNMYTLKVRECEARLKAEALIRPLLEELTSRHMLCDQCCQDSRQCRAKQAIKAVEKYLEGK